MATTSVATSFVNYRISSNLPVAWFSKLVCWCVCVWIFMCWWIANANDFLWLSLNFPGLIWNIHKRHSDSVVSNRTYRLIQPKRTLSSRSSILLCSLAANPSNRSESERKAGLLTRTHTPVRAHTHTIIHIHVIRTHIVSIFKLTYFTWEKKLQQNRFVSTLKRGTKFSVVSLHLWFFSFDFDFSMINRMVCIWICW